MTSNTPSHTPPNPPNPLDEFSLARVIHDDSSPLLDETFHDTQPASDCGSPEHHLEHLSKSAILDLIPLLDSSRGDPLPNERSAHSVPLMTAAIECSVESPTVEDDAVSSQFTPVSSMQSQHGSGDLLLRDDKADSMHSLPQTFEPDQTKSPVNLLSLGLWHILLDVVAH